MSQILKRITNFGSETTLRECQVKMIGFYILTKKINAARSVFLNLYYLGKNNAGINGARFNRLNLRHRVV
jgi:hypothetical protein